MGEKMIEIEKAKIELENHVKNLTIKDKKVQRKLDHIKRVAEISKKIARKLELNENEIQLAELIGLLHDIGRFEQYQKLDATTSIKKLDTTKKFDHGSIGVEVLKKNDYIRKYIEEATYDSIIYTAIYEHNKYELSKNLTKKEELFSKIIKDADKIDIIYEAIAIYWQEPEKINKIEEGILSEKMLEDFYLQKLSNHQNRKSEIDQILRFTSFIFDLNFKYSFQMLKESDNISNMINRFDYKNQKTKEEMEKIKKISNQYIEEKTK